MKYISTILLAMLIYATATAQRWDNYVISVNGDTINIVDKDKKKQGRWVTKVESLRGEPGYEDEGVYVDGAKEGAWRRYNLTGDILAIENYKWGYKDGKQLYFSSLGDLIREESWKAVNPKNPYDTIEVPDLNNPMVSVQKVVKHEGSELKHGAWKYYNPSTGLIFKTENFSYGQKLDGLGRPIVDSKVSNGSNRPVNADRPKTIEKPPAVLEWEKKNAGKKKIDVRDGRTGG